MLRWLFGPSKKELRSIIERQMALISDPKILDLELEPGGALRMDLEPCIGAKILAASFADLLGKAPNWASLLVGPMPSDNGMLIVTVQRQSGDSPEATVGKLKDLIRKMRSALADLNAIDPPVLLDSEADLIAKADLLLDSSPV